MMGIGSCFVASKHAVRQFGSGVLMAFRVEVMQACDVTLTPFIP